MLFQIALPDLGEGVVEAEVQRWFVEPGARVAEDQPLVEVMTDKATVTIPSPRAGRVARLCCEVGQLARVHTPLVELELDEVASGGNGTERRADAGGAGPDGSAPPDRSLSFWGAAGAAEARQRPLATPAVRAMARSMGVDLGSVQGSGKGGRVTKQDLAQTARPAAQGSANGGNGEASGFEAPFEEGGEHPPRAAPEWGRGPAAGERGPSDQASGREARIPLHGLRRRMAENMARSKRTAAHFTFVEQAEVSDLVRLKHRMADAARPEGVRLTYLAFVVKAVVAALKRFPEMNASLDEERNELVVKRWYDIGIASATDDGLVVPVVRGADRLSVLDVAREVARLALEAKGGRLRPEDVGGSTFTITNLGRLGGLFGTPVLNHPEVGILGVHRIRPTPVVREGQVVIRDVMYVSTTGDHRVVDGQQVARFTYQVVKYLEDPGLLFLEMV